MNRPFWLGIIGCVFGFMLVLCGFLLFFVADVIAATQGKNADSLLINIFLTAIFSGLGLAASLMDTKKTLGAWLMIISAIGVFLSFFPFGALSGFFFLLGGIVKFSDRKKLLEGIPVAQ